MRAEADDLARLRTVIPCVWRGGLCGEDVAGLRRLGANADHETCIDFAALMNRTSLRISMCRRAGNDAFAGGCNLPGRRTYDVPRLGSSTRRGAGG